MSQRAYYSFPGVDWKYLLWEIAVIKNMRYHVKNCSCYPVILIESLVHGQLLWSPALSQMYLSLTFQHCCKNSNEFYFPDRSDPVKQFTVIIFNEKILACNASQRSLQLFCHTFDLDLQYNLRKGWRHVFNGDCDHCSWKKLNNWSQCWWSLRCCDQSVHMCQNCLRQSWKHVCDGAYDHYNNMETWL